MKHKILKLIASVALFMSVTYANKQARFGYIVQNCLKKLKLLESFN